MIFEVIILRDPKCQGQYLSFPVNPNRIEPGVYCLRVWNKSNGPFSRVICIQASHFQSFCNKHFTRSVVSNVDNAARLVCWNRLFHFFHRTNLMWSTTVYEFPFTVWNLERSGTRPLLTFSEDCDLMSVVQC